VAHGLDVVTQTVVLAAGTGTRLGSAEAGVPKPLLTVAGMPLIAHALRHAAASGCTDAIVVIGFEGRQVKEAVEAIRSPLRIRFVETADHTAPNGHSLLAAEPFARPRFFLQMVDHLFEDVVLPKLAAPTWRADELARVLVDAAPVGLDLDDATKVRMEEGRVVAIGKAVAPWDAIDAGCFALTHAVFPALRAVTDGGARTVSSAMRQLADCRALCAVDLGGIRWVDVDTPRDRADAERMLAAPAARGHAD
jgi:1L-myo-inositol 1-phosphate cytidylyltransferase